MNKKQKNNKINWKKFKRFFLNLSNFKIILIVYTFITLFAAILLFLPAAQQEQMHGKVDFIGSLFTAASAFSDTGLTVYTTASTWNDFGQAIIAILILLGGIGVFALKVYIVNFVFGKKFSLYSRNILDKERGANDLGNIKKTIIVSVSVLFILIIIFTFILTFIFYAEEGNFIGKEQIYNPYHNWALSFKYGIFHAISAINNAGFDIISNASLQPYYSVYSIQIVFIILLVIGGIGYPVIYDLYSFFQSKLRRSKHFRFSLFTKISCTTYLIIVLFGLVLSFIFETNSQNGVWKNSNLGTYGDKTMAIIFQVFSTRNAGFATLSLSNFSDATILLFSIMMFIGSAPSSTAGGIRTTTIALIFLSLWNRLKGSPNVRVSKKTISKNVVYNSYLVLAISLVIVFITTFIAITSIKDYGGKYNGTMIDVIFEVCSAFGTTGLSTGLTPYLNIVSQLFLLIVMFIGQLGISSTILVWKREKNSQNNYEYLEEEIAIG